MNNLSFVEMREVAHSMGRLENLSENDESRDSRATTEDLLRAMANDLRSLQQDVVSQLHQDVQRLQAEKSRLVSDIEKLQHQRQLMQSQHEMALSHQQLAQQQAWAKQLALALANHLHAALTQRLNQTLVNTQNPQIHSTVNLSGLSTPQVDTENTYRVLASIDETVSRAFNSLNHDLSSYQSALSQQINRMHDLGQQGEAILEVLVGRISQQLQSEGVKRSSGSPIPPNPPSVQSASSSTDDFPDADFLNTNFSNTNFPSANFPNTVHIPEAKSGSPSSSSFSFATTPFPEAASSPAAVSPSSGSVPATPTPIAPSPVTPSPVTPSPVARKSHPFRSGVIFILFSTAMLALHYVIVQIVGTEGRLFGSAELVVGGYLSLATFSSALLLLWVRMIAIVPLLAWLSGLLYPPVWRDVKAFFVVYDRRLLMSLIGSGIFLLLSQTFLYIAINEIGPAVAAALAAIYPLATLPLTWMLFGDRPTRLKLVALATIGLGAGMALFAAQTALSNEGIVAGIISSVTFALYLVAMLIINRRKLNPVPISLIQNSTMFVLSSLFLIGIGSRATPSNWLGLMVGGFILGGLTIVSYFLNDVGSRLLGPARATLITASVPALTALLAFLVLPSPQNSLSIGQIFGILIVTAGSALLSLERIMNQVKAARQRRIEEYSNG